MDDRTKAALDTFTFRLVDVPEVEAAWVAGSLAIADHVPGVSDLDLVASHAPEWLKEQMRARRRGAKVTSPRSRSAYLAWRDVRGTTR